MDIKNLLAAVNASDMEKEVKAEIAELLWDWSELKLARVEATIKEAEAER